VLDSLDTHSYIRDDYIPHKREYESWRARLTDAEHNEPPRFVRRLFQLSPASLAGPSWAS
jgi:hypothetical protein